MERITAITDIIEGYRIEAISALNRLSASITLHCDDPDDQTLAAIALEAEAAAMAARKYLSRRQRGSEIRDAAATIASMADDLSVFSGLHPDAQRAVVNIRHAAMRIVQEVA
ncbi:MAG: hypothetical protein AB1568_04595 [Thermodesulfobacteriota bacterium]